MEGTPSMTDFPGSGLWEGKPLKGKREYVSNCFIGHVAGDKGYHFNCVG